MAEISTRELYRYRSHRTLQELHDYKKLRVRIKTEGVRVPLELETDGQYVFLAEGHKRLMIAVELGIKRLPVTIIERPFSTRRRVMLVGPPAQITGGVAAQVQIQMAPGIGHITGLEDRAHQPPDVRHSGHHRGAEAGQPQRVGTTPGEVDPLLVAEETPGMRAEHERLDGAGPGHNVVLHGDEVLALAPRRRHEV